MRSFILAAGLVAFLGALPALAQAPQGTPVNVRGTIVKLSGQTLTVKMRDGKTADIALAPDAGVRALKKAKLSDIKDGDYIASSSVQGKDGKLHALEIHFLAPSTPEGQRPWDLRKDSVMTNAHVTGVAKVTGGTDLTVTFKGQSTDIVVGPKTIIVGPADASMADLKRGKAVFLFANKAADGTISARVAFVEKNGVKPPL